MGWLGIDWHACEALATIMLILVGLWQIKGIRSEAKKERTLVVCNKYDEDLSLDRSLRELRASKISGTLPSDIATYRSNVVTVLNYLDGIAIGIAQGLYIESLARDHLQHIVEDHCNDYLTNQTAQMLSFRLADYSHLAGLKKSWTDQTPYFTDKWKIWK